MPGIRIHYAAAMETVGGTPETGALTQSGVDIHLIRILRVIATGGTITSAARLMGYSQPAISQHLQRAESKLGLPLVRRAGRATSLTEAGALISDRGESILVQIDDLTRELRDLSDTRSRRVALAGFPTASSTIVPEVLSRLRAHRADIALSYHEAEPPEALNLLRDGAVDMAITFRYEEALDDSPEQAGLRSTHLLQDPLLFALPATHRLASRSTIAIADARNETWVAGCPRCRTHLVSLTREAGFTPNIYYETDNIAAVLSMVARGIGIALLPRLSLSSLSPSPDVVLRQPKIPTTRSVELVRSGDRPLSPAALFVTRAIVDICANQGVWRG